MFKYLSKSSEFSPTNRLSRGNSSSSIFSRSSPNRSSGSPSSLGSLHEDEEVTEFTEVDYLGDGQKPAHADSWLLPKTIPYSSGIVSDSGKTFILFDAQGSLVEDRSQAVYAVVRGLKQCDFRAHNKYPTLFPAVFREGEFTIMEWFPKSITVTFEQNQGSGRVSKEIESIINKFTPTQKSELMQSLKEIGELKENFTDLQFIIDLDTGRAMLIDPEGMRENPAKSLLETHTKFRKFCEQVNDLCAPELPQFYSGTASN